MEKVIIKDKTYSNVEIERFCYLVNEYLGIVPFDDCFKIYSLIRGKPFIGTKFKTLKDAEGAAKVLTDVYGDWFPIWKNPEFVEADIPSLTRYTVKHGIELYEFIVETCASGDIIQCESLHLD